jgi:DnaJ-class molecular chaperone
MTETQVCHCCFGQGHMPGEGRADCPYCDGTGFVTKEIEEGEDDD